MGSQGQGLCSRLHVADRWGILGGIAGSRTLLKTTCSRQMGDIRWDHRVKDFAQDYM